MRSNDAICHHLALIYMNLPFNPYQLQVDLPCLAGSLLRTHCPS